MLNQKEKTHMNNCKALAKRLQDNLSLFMNSMIRVWKHKFNLLKQKNLSPPIKI